MILEVSPEQVERVKMSKYQPQCCIFLLGSFKILLTILLARAVHEKFEAGVNFSFNYNVLLLVAAVVAGLGLASNSSATVIARYVVCIILVVSSMALQTSSSHHLVVLYQSMLVSPIMGPVVGLAYGTTINDWKLVRLSLRNETISLIFCILVGFVIGSITGVTALANEGMTSEMESRASLSTFVVALPVAFFSGLGVAVGLLDEQTNSLVGVAISASLLPPAVNAGTSGWERASLGVSSLANFLISLMCQESSGYTTPMC